MLPGKKYAPDDYVKIVWRRRWLVIIPALVVAAGTFLYARSLPDRYRSSALVLIIPQGVPADFVRSTIDTPIAQRLQMITQEILTRTRLERLMQDFNLYEEERRTMVMEDVINRMRNDIRIQPIGGGRGIGQTSFRVSFDSSQPRVAARVAEELAALFVKENVENREILAATTTQFLGSELETARQRLIEHEKRLEDFKRANAGRLPTQAQSNVQMLQTSQSQLQAVNEATNRDRDRLLFLDRALVDAEAALEAAVIATTNSPQLAPAAKGPAMQQLEAARANLRGLEARLRPAHPDLARARRQVAELEVKADAEALAQPLAPSVPDATIAAERAARSRVAELRKEISQLQARLEDRKADERRAQASIESYRARLEAVPGLESNLVELMRDYGTLQESYTSLLRKSEQSKLAVNLERRQIGQQFRLVDAPRVPERPFSPNRNRINMMGLMAGLALGIGLVALLEYRDTTIKTDEDVVVSLSLPVLAVIPAMFTKAERVRNRRRRLLAVTASVIVAVSGAAVAVWRYQLLSVVEGWVR